MEVEELWVATNPKDLDFPEGTEVAVRRITGSKEAKITVVSGCFQGHGETVWEQPEEFDILKLVDSPKKTTFFLTVTLMRLFPQGSFTTLPQHLVGCWAHLQKVFWLNRGWIFLERKTDKAMDGEEKTDKDRNNWLREEEILLWHWRENKGGGRGRKEKGETKWNENVVRENSKIWIRRGVGFKMGLTLVVLRTTNVQSTYYFFSSHTHIQITQSQTTLTLHRLSTFHTVVYTGCLIHAYIHKKTQILDSPIYLVT